jgi:RNA polymerase sigma-70 factor (ECF subfamily)
VAPLSEAAFGDLYRLEARRLWAYVYRTTGQANDADDIVQEAFCRVLGADIGTLAAEERRRYLFRVAGNLVADRWRTTERERTWRERMTGTQPVTTPPVTHDDEDVTRTFAALKPRDRALLWLAYVEHEDHESIAAALGLKRGSVKVLLSRARARLRELLTAAQRATGT